MSRNDLAYVRKDGWVYWRLFNRQPSTDDIANNIPDKDYRYVIQQIGGRFCVYALATLKRFVGGASIGVPVFESEDLDAALMFAVLEGGTE